MFNKRKKVTEEVDYKLKLKESDYTKHYKAYIQK